MIAWINFAVLLFASLLFLFFYVRSVSPAGREKIIGPRAYRLCFYDRLISGGLEFIITGEFCSLPFLSAAISFICSVPLAVVGFAGYRCPHWRSGCIVDGGGRA